MPRRSSPHPRTSPANGIYRSQGLRALLSSAAFLALAYRAERRFQALPTLPSNPPQGPLPSLSIIIPARNEEANLPPLLDSLCRLRYDGELEIIVVDDGSTDATAAIARRYPVRLLQNDHLPPGWTGKTYACHYAAGAASGDWLLFVDADTRHHPDGAALAVAHACTQKLDGLSLFLPNVTSGAADRLALMVAYAAFFAANTSYHAALNGQYILLRRDAYSGSGGFRAVRRHVTEDLALGRLLQRRGYRVPIMRGDAAGAVRMYDNAPQLWLGLSRFAVASLRWTGLNGLQAVLLVILLAAPLEMLLVSFVKGGVRPALFSWLAAAVAVHPWASRFGGRAWALFAPIGAMQVQLSSLWGIIRRLRGHGVRWKGRDL